MTFRFRLEKVLRWRQRREDEEARALRAAVDDLRAATRARRELELELARLAAEGERRRGDGDVARWRLLAAFLTAQEARLQGLRARERAATATVTSRRQRLVEAHREKEILVRLREKQRLDHEEQERRRERRALDEVGARRAARREQPGVPRE